MASEADKNAPAPAPTKRGGWVILGLVAVLSAGSGFAIPRFLAHDPSGPQIVSNPEAKKPAVIPFGDVVVNLGEDRLTRYLRVKILLVVEGGQETAINEHLGKQKAYLKSWLISYLSDLSLQEVSRAVGVNRLRREIRDQFNAMLWPDGQELVLDVLFDEFVVQ